MQATADPRVTATAEPSPEEDWGPYPMPLSVPIEMETDDVAGAEAFLYYFVDVANYAASQNDAAALKFYCDDLSNFCDPLIEGINSRIEEGLTPEGARLVLESVVSTEVLGDGRYYAVRGDFTAGPGRLLDADGAVIEETAEQSFTADAIVERLDTGYWVLYALGKVE